MTTMAANHLFKAGMRPSSAGMLHSMRNVPLRPKIFPGALFINTDQSSTKPSSSARVQQPPGKSTEALRNTVANTETRQKNAGTEKQMEKDPFILQQDAGWFTRILKGRANPQQQAGGAQTASGEGASGASGMASGAHSALGTKKVVYELQFHKIFPDSVDKYLQSYGQLVDHIQHHGGESDNAFSMQLVGSWLVNTGGDQDQVVNLWKHGNGYNAMDNDVKKLTATGNGEAEGSRLVRDYSRFLRKRQSQYLLAFGFWGDPTTKVRQGTNLYEIRSYSLKPGTMVDWANHWARAIHIRKKDSAPVGGFFSQVGHMYKVYHIWSYVDLEDRRQSRDLAWRYPGWDECVQATVPLIKDMQSRLMYATPFSPLQ